MADFKDVINKYGNRKKKKINFIYARFKKRFFYWFL